MVAALGSISAGPAVQLWLETQAGDSQDGHYTHPFSCPRDVSCPLVSHHELPSGGPEVKAAFSFKTTQGGSGAKARAVRSSGDLSLRKYFLQ